MKELKELRVNGNCLILDGHHVLTTIIPQSYREMENDVLVRGEAVVDGATYARRLTIETGPLTMDGAVFVKEELHAKPENATTTTFKKAVACGARVVMLDAGRKIFGADLNSSIVKLKNAVVAANVFASEIDLEDCVVLGGVFSTKILHLKNSVVGTFSAPSVIISGDNYMLHPTGFSVEPLCVTENARLVNLSLADWGNLLKGLPERPMTGSIEINPRVDEQEISLKDKEGNTTLWQTYSVAAKVLASDMLDMKKLDNHFLLSAGSLSGQLIKLYDFGCDRLGKPIRLSIETIGQFFSDIQSGKISVRPLASNVSFEDLKKFYSE